MEHPHPRPHPLLAPVGDGEGVAGCAAAFYLRRFRRVHPSVLSLVRACSQSRAWRGGVMMDISDIYPTGEPPEFEAVERSRRVLREAVETFKPNFIISMVSGGNDSACAHHVAMEAGIKIDAIIHIITGTGIPETTEFVRSYYGKMGI